MKFRLAQDAPDDLTYLLRELNHDVFRLRDVLPVAATHSAVLTCAEEHDCLLVTCNRDDFINLAETQRHRGIIVIIRRKTRSAERAALLRLLERAGEMVSAKHQLRVKRYNRA